MKSQTLVHAVAAVLTAVAAVLMARAASLRAAVLLSLASGVVLTVAVVGRWTQGEPAPSSVVRKRGGDGPRA